MMKVLEQFLKDAVTLGKLTEIYILNSQYLGQNVLDIIENWQYYAVWP